MSLFDVYDENSWSILEEPKQKNFFFNRKKKPLGVAYGFSTTSLTNSPITGYHLTLLKRHLPRNEASALHHCLKIIDKTLNKLRETHHDLKLYLNMKTLYQHTDNLKTLISAVIMNQVMCLDGSSHDDTDKHVKETNLREKTRFKNASVRLRCGVNIYRKKKEFHFLRRKLKFHLKFFIQTHSHSLSKCTLKRRLYHYRVKPSTNSDNYSGYLVITSDINVLVLLGWKDSNQLPNLSPEVERTVVVARKIQKKRFNSTTKFSSFHCVN
uniref:Pectinesterase inhibitor domain-containing protein n=1 Tax=Glycine max TaxID=3847 RepID=K7KBD4_SOYBN